MEKVIHRLKKFADHKGLTMRKFDFSIEASDGYTQRTLKNQGSVGSDILEKIIDIYPEINPYWLLKGEGEMLREPDSNHFASKETAPEYDLFEITLLQYLEKASVQEKIKSIIRDEGTEETADR